MTENASMETQQTKPPGLGCTALVRLLVPGHGWTRIGGNVWEDMAGNRVIPTMAINAIALRPCGGETRFLHTYESPLKEALRRNANKRRAGLAAAKAYFAEANDQVLPVADTAAGSKKNDL